MRRGAQGAALTRDHQRLGSRGCATVGLHRVSGPEGRDLRSGTPGTNGHQALLFTPGGCEVSGAPGRGAARGTDVTESAADR
jgi:hypothetical protein